MKKICLLFTLALTAFSTYAYDVEIEGIWYDAIPKIKEASVIKYKNNVKYKGDVIIPETITVDGKECSVTSVGSEAFWDCSGLTSVDIPNSVTSIGSQAFYWCTSLTTVTVGNSLTSVGSWAFLRCTSLTQPIFNEHFFAHMPTSYEGSYIIPDGIKKIANEAFSDCSGLTTLTIPNSVTSIGDYAFDRCASLASVTIPNSVTSIGTGAFYGCSGLTSVTLPNSVSFIPYHAFEACSGLTSVTIPNSVNQIGGEAFYGCSSLTSVTIPNSVNWIYIDAFYRCSNLTSLTLGNSVMSIGDYAFGFCDKLETVTCLAEKVPETGNDVFVGSYIEYSTLKVPESSLEEYCSSYPWIGFGKIEGINGAIQPNIPIDWALDDGENFANEDAYNNRNIIYTRNFTNTNWNALYVPFAMQYEDWAADFEVARLNDVHQFDDDEDGVIDRTVLEVVKMKEGSSTEPNTPYMIKAKEAGEKTITLTDATLYAAEENSFDVTSWYTKFTFTGTYSTVTDMATKGHYALANGGLMQASSDAATLGAFRWYLDITDRNGNPAPLKAKKVFLSFDDGETTAINLVEANTETNNGSIYSISGVKVGAGKASLTKGLYISNGKKYLIK